MTSLLDPREALGLKQATVAPAQPILPASAHGFTHSLYWPGDEIFHGEWDSQDYYCKPRSIMRVGEKLRHQRDGVGRVMFHSELEPVPEIGDPASVAKALIERYGHMGLIILGQDDNDAQRKKEARELKYNPWRLNKALENRARHRSACAVAMRNGVPAPVPPPTFEADEAFIRMMQSGGVDLAETRFVCQVDGSRHRTRSAAWDRVRQCDASQMGNPAAVHDTMPRVPDPEEGKSAAEIQIPPKPSGQQVVEAASPIDALKNDVRELYVRAGEEDIVFPKELRAHLKSDDIETLQLAIDQAKEILDGPTA